MIRSVIFDMYETLVTHYRVPLYFGAQIAEDAGIPKDKFLALWTPTEYDRTVGKIRLEDVLENIFRENNRCSEELIRTVVQKRINTKRECFRHLQPQILPMLSELKARGLLLGLISNCYSEEAEAIRESELFPYFDAAMLSCEQGIQKPDEAIFKRCMERLSVKTEECLYVGDGGSHELETAQMLGMKAAQAVWYLCGDAGQPSGRKLDFLQLENPFDILSFLDT